MFTGVPLSQIPAWVRRNKDQVLLLAMLIPSLIINVWLGSIHGRALQIEGAAERTSRVGVVLPPLQVLDIDGRKAGISWSTGLRGTVIYIFSPACMWCTRNSKNIAMLFREHRRDYRFIGLSTATDDLKKYTAAQQLFFPVYIIADRRLLEPMGFAGTPHTVVVSPSGKIVQLWGGAYSKGTGEEVEGFFGVTLPGLSGVATAIEGIPFNRSKFISEEGVVAAAR